MIQQPGMPVTRGENLDKISVWDWCLHSRGYIPPVMYQGRLVLWAAEEKRFPLVFRVGCCGIMYHHVGPNTNLDIIRIER